MKHPTTRSLNFARVSLALLLVWAAIVAAGKLVWADEGHGEEETHAAAAGPTIALELPPEMAVGKEATLLANLTGSGPLVGAEVVFVATLTFAGTQGEVVLGRAVTDDLGLARLTYLPRSQGDMAIGARFAGNGQLGPAEASQKVTVQPGPPLYQETAGVKLPVIGLWLLIAVLTVVWSIYFTVTVIVGRIALKGLATPAERTKLQEPVRVTAGTGGTAND